MGDDQEPVFRFLAEPATHGGVPVKRIDTHAATLFLAGERVFKVKRAVRFPFLDYSTLEKREAACTAELKVNLPYASEIYRRVVPITRDDGGMLALGGDGTPCEWAVEMLRFDEQATLDHLAGQGRIDLALADALGRVVAAAHRQAAPVEPEPWIAALGSYIDEHAEAFGARPDLFPAADVAALAQAGRTAYSRIRDLLIERGKRGLVRHIHGDLHLGNIALIDGRPVLFDAIEFSALIASGDVLYDLAFLLMDLTERGLTPAANAVFNRYLTEAQRAEDIDALAALPFYLSMRAAIRAKVTAERLAQVDDEKNKTELARAARRYFDWALRFLSPAPPVFVAIGGLSGTGKSVLARGLAPELSPSPGAVVFRSDVERKSLFGKDEPEELPSEAYTSAVTARVYATLADKARRAVAAGHSAIVDAVFAHPRERAAARRSADALKVPFRGLFLTVDLASRLERVAHRSRDASDADATVAREQERYDLGALDWTRIDASGTAPETLARLWTAIGR